MIYNEGKVTMHEKFILNCENLTNDIYLERFVNDITKILETYGITDKRKQKDIIDQLCKYKYILPIEFIESYNDANGRRKMIINLVNGLLSIPDQNQTHDMNLATKITYDIFNSAKTIYNDVLKNYIEKYNVAYFKY